MKGVAIIHAGSAVHSAMRGETLDLNTIVRLQRGIEALDNREVERLGVVAGYGSVAREVSPGVEEREGRSRINLGLEMIAYLAQNGVPSRYVMADVRGQDTVGEVVYARHSIISPHGIRELLAITNEWHRPRVKAIYDHILGDSYMVDVVPVFTRWDEEPALSINREAERSRLAVFTEQFGETEEGDFNGIVECLYAKHALYKNTPVAERILPNVEVP